MAGGNQVQVTITTSATRKNQRIYERGGGMYKMRETVKGNNKVDK